jgi:transposase InsO family protein
MRKYSERTDISVAKLLSWAGISRSKYYDWEKRYGKVNEHNTLVPRDFWLEAWEKESILAFYLGHPLEGYRRVTYMMMDQDIVAVSPSTVYRVLQGADMLRKWNRKTSPKGNGFQGPSFAHEHWHIDISYLNVCGTFYYLCSLLDGYSRFIVHWEIRERMTEMDVEIIVQRAREAFPGVTPRIISDNGPQFLCHEFKEYIRLCGMTHVKTSPNYPQSNGKMERFFQSLKRECIRPKTPLSLEDARRIVAEFVDTYNNHRLHSAIGYITPRDKLEGREKEILQERERKLQEAREKRKERRREIFKQDLTFQEENRTVSSIGETEASSAGGQLARDSRSGFRHETWEGEALNSPPPIPQSFMLIPPMPKKNSDPPEADHYLKSKCRLSISR